MTHFVKSFIQNNKDFINNENWYAVSREWYEAAERTSLFDEPEWFMEFCHVLHVADINYLEESREDRKKIIELNLIPEFNKFVSSAAKTRFKEQFTFGLASTLGLSNATIESIADSVAQTFNLHIDFEHYEKLG